jgi:hypothetical protein
VELVFQNGIDYHPPEAVLHLIAEYGMDEFHRLASGLNFRTEQEWLDAVSKLSTKISNLAAKPPAARKTNPIVSSLRTKAEASPLPHPDSILPLVEKLNSIIHDDAIRDDICAILKEIQGLDIEAASKQPIDAEKLKPLTVNMLILYLTFRES